MCNAETDGPIFKLILWFQAQSEMKHLTTTHSTPPLLCHTSGLRIETELVC